MIENIKHEYLKDIKKEVYQYTNKYLKDEIFKRFDNKCALCSSTNDLVIHHNTYRLNPKIEDCILLCDPCHVRLSKANAQYIIETKYLKTETKNKDSIITKENIQQKQLVTIDIPILKKTIKLENVLEIKLKRNLNLCKVYLVIAYAYQNDKIDITPRLIAHNLKEINGSFAYSLLMEFVNMGLLNKIIKKKVAYFMPNKPLNEIITKEYIEIVKNKLNIE